MKCIYYKDKDGFIKTTFYKKEMPEGSKEITFEEYDAEVKRYFDEDIKDAKKAEEARGEATEKSKKALAKLDLPEDVINRILNI